MVFQTPMTPPSLFLLPCFVTRILLLTLSRRSACTFILRSDLNRLVMDYLVIEGYKTAAEEFSKEANLAPPIDLDSIETRMSIREAVQRGEVEEAIAKVNDLDAEVNPLSPWCIFPHGSLLHVVYHLRASVTNGDDFFI